MSGWIEQRRKVGTTVLVTGDFNIPDRTTQYDRLKESLENDLYRLRHPVTAAHGGTYRDEHIAGVTLHTVNNQFAAAKSCPTARIDYGWSPHLNRENVFVDAGLLFDEPQNENSDHFGVRFDLRRFPAGS